VRVEVWYGRHRLADNWTSGGDGRGYCFEAPEGVELGDVLSDGGQPMTVVRIGSDYSGPVRSAELMARRSEVRG
jgi:hypothetical protein